jgi:hypothetical protein
MLFLSVCQSVLIVVLWGDNVEIFGEGKPHILELITDPYTLIHSLEEGAIGCLGLTMMLVMRKCWLKSVGYFIYSLGKCPLFIYSAMA